MDLNEIAIFIKVVQLGSFIQASKALNIPNSTVSSKVSSLEKRLGVTLIQRTTRKLSITDVGQAYYNRCLQGLEEIKTAESEISSTQGEPSGLLRITAPADMGRSILPDIISKYTDKYPKVSVETLLTDRRVDLLSEGVDLAIRAGVLKDSTLIAKKLGTSYFVPLASPKYLKQYGEPSHPRELKDHLIIHFPPMGTNEWRLFSPKGGFSATVRPRVIINDLYANFELALRGDGIALLPAYMCQREIHAKKLVRILPDWRTSVNPVHFVYAGQKFVSPKLSSFITFAQPYIKTLFTEGDI